ncbi:unnamed protein product [Caenorhabditis brenneri]
MSSNAPENRTPEASFNVLIRGFRESRPIPEEFFERIQELIDLSLEICKILDGAELRLSSVIGVVPKKALNEIFRKMFFALGRLQEILAGVLKTFRGENDGSTVPGKMKEWAKITSTIILFLTDVYLKLYDFDIEAGQLVEVNNLLNRVMVLNYSETFMRFVKVVGDTEKMAGFKEKIEDHQLQLGFLLDAIKTITNYN